MTAGLRFQLLGPVRAWRGEVELDVGSPQQRAVLVVLLLGEGRRVSLSEVVEALWGESLPPSHVGIVRTYIYRLRQVFMPSDVGLGPDVSIVSDAGGYRLVLNPDVVDVGLFRRGLAAGREARECGDLVAARECLREGLALWDGAPLAGVAGFFDGRRGWLEQLRLAACEELWALDIELGDHADAVAELTAAVAAQPYRERLWELLMVALYRCGRQVDALSAYREVGRLLGREVGLDPGPGLRELHSRILAADPALSRSHNTPPLELVCSTASESSG